MNYKTLLFFPPSQLQPEEEEFSGNLVSTVREMRKRRMQKMNRKMARILKGIFLLL